MANIFGGAELPNWLVKATHEDSGGLGQSMGTALAGGLLALQPNESGDGVKGFEQGIAEARMNQQDPQWKVKEKLLEGRVMSTWAQAATQWQGLDASTRDMAAWTAYDLPAITKFQEELKTNPEAVPPVVQSSKGMQAVSQLEKAQLAVQGMRLKQDASRLNLENAKTSLAFDQALSTAPIEIQSEVDGMNGPGVVQGWNVDRQGKRLTPSKPALTLYNQWATDSGKNPERAFGFKSNAAINAKLKTEGQLKVADENIAGRLKVVDETGKLRSALEDKRETNREALVGVKELSQEKLEQLKASLKPDVKGNVPTEAAFVQREFRTVYADLRKNPQVGPDGKLETEQTSAQRARQILQRVYQSMAARPAAPAPGTKKILKWDEETQSLK